MRSWLLALAFGLALLFASPGGVAWAGGPEYEQQVVDLVNRVRADAGLPPLRASSELTTAARRYAAYMASAGFFGHQGADGSTYVTRDEAAGYRGWTFLAENLAAGQVDPPSVVSGWLNSPSHRANILAPAAREIGVGYVFQAGTPYGHYWAQEFGARPGIPAAAPSPAPRPAVAPTPALRPGLSARGGAPRPPEPTAAPTTPPAAPTAAPAPGPDHVIVTGAPMRQI